MNRSKITAAVLAAFAIASLSAQDPPKPKEPPQQQDALAALKESMKARYPLLEQLRDAGKIGETRGGEAKLVDAKFGAEKADPKDAAKGTVGDVVAAENKDRRALYEHLAKKEKLTAEEVGRQNFVRYFGNAKPDHWIEVQGKWVQRKTVKAVDDKGSAGDGK
jgi:uncharacterized protein YdbL (DUF1318 family)